MEAQRVYIKLMRLILKSSSNLSQRRIKELNSGIGELRQLLSCAVCCQLLMDPYKPKGRRCGHHVCRLCLRGQKHLYPTCPQCADCSDFKTYEENKAMALQLLCYKTLCVHLLNSPVYAQLERQKPNLFSIYTVQNTPRIKLPVRSTHWFIQEGAHYEDMCETFLPQPDLMSFRGIPGALPAETPPTTAATTPELTYEQHMPEQLSLTDIELEAAATGDQAHFAQPLPLIPSGARMLSHSHIAPAAEMMLPASYIDPSWTEQVDLASAFPVNTYSNTASEYTTYVVPSNELNLPTIGQVVEIPQHIATASLEPPSADPGSSGEANVGFKRRHAEMLDEVEEKLEDEQTAPAAEASGMSTREGLRSQKPTILSSVVVQLSTVDAANSKPVTTDKIEEVPVTAPEPTKYQKTKFKEARMSHICRCGTTSGTGNTTCRNNRCTCYIAGKSCVDCKCVGCKNPHKDEVEGDSSDDSESIEEHTPAPAAEEAAAPQTQLQTGYHLVPLDNLQQTQHPLVLIQNEHGQYQGFNIFNGNEPMDPALAGFQRVPLRSNDGNNAIPQYAYVMPSATMESTTEQPQSSPAITEQTVKKYKHDMGEDTLTPVGDCSLSNFSPIESVEEFVSGSSTNNPAAGDSLATNKEHSFEKRKNTSFEDKAHSLFEDIMSGSDDFLCNVRHEVVSVNSQMPYIAFYNTTD